MSNRVVPVLEALRGDRILPRKHRSTPHAPRAPTPNRRNHPLLDEDGRARVECRFAGETVWLTQALMAELYQKDVRTINEHLQNFFEEEELDPEANHPEIPDSSPRRHAGGHPAHRPLQPGCDPGCGLPGAWHLSLQRKSWTGLAASAPRGPSSAGRPDPSRAGGLI